MEICHKTLLNYADYCYFFSQGGTMSCSGNFSYRGDVHVHSLPHSTFMDEVLKEERVKNEN